MAKVIIIDHYIRKSFSIGAQINDLGWPWAAYAHYKLGVFQSLPRKFKDDRVTLKQSDIIIIIIITLFAQRTQRNKQWIGQ